MKRHTRRPKPVRRPVQALTDKSAMELAIRRTMAGIRKGQSPFGCCITRAGRLLSVCHNTVWQDTDPTRHAEVNAIQKACRKLGTIDLSGCTLYATCEPCPMCFSAAHWARVSRVVYGASIKDAQQAGFNEIRLRVHELRKLSGNEMELVSGFMREECKKVFTVWKKLARGKAY